MIKKNIRFLRKFLHNDTQKALAHRLGITQGMFSEYESGKKPVSIDIAKQIANIYNVPLDDLIKKDLASEYDFPRFLTVEDAHVMGENLFPIMTSELAETNPNFTRAYRHMTDSFRFESLDEFESSIDKLELAVSLFQSAWEQTNCYVALSNSISVILLIFSFYDRHKTQIARELMDNDKVKTATLLRGESPSAGDSIRFEEKQRSILLKHSDIVYGNIKLLKSNLSFAQLGDYYLALCTFLNFDEDFIGTDEGIHIGSYMLYQLHKLKNEYALKFIENISFLS